MQKILLASTNHHKIREMRDLFALFLPQLKIDFFTLRDFPSFVPADEEGDCFEKIAAEKALLAARNTGMLALADDSGLVVPALGGEPGIRSARYAGEISNDAANRRKLIQKVALLKESQRQAYFICAMALASPQGLIRVVSGRVEGSVLCEERGSFGFGYDPLFLRHDYHKTFAELEPAIKVRTDHRGKAFALLAETLEHSITAGFGTC